MKRSLVAVAALPFRFLDVAAVDIQRPTEATLSNDESYGNLFGSGMFSLARGGRKNKKSTKGPGGRRSKASKAASEQYQGSYATLAPSAANTESGRNAETTAFPTPAPTLNRNPDLPEIRANPRAKDIEEFKRGHYLLSDCPIEVIVLSPNLLSMASAFLAGDPSGGADFMAEMASMQLEIAMMMNQIELMNAGPDDSAQKTTGGRNQRDLLSTFLTDSSATLQSPKLMGVMYQNLMQTFSTPDIIARDAPEFREGEEVEKLDDGYAGAAMFGGPQRLTPGVLVGEIKGCQVFVETSFKGELKYLSVQCKSGFATHLLPFSKDSNSFAIVSETCYDNAALAALFRWEDAEYDEETAATFESQYNETASTESSNNTDDLFGDDQTTQKKAKATKGKGDKKEKQTKGRANGNGRRAVELYNHERQLAEGCPSFNIIELAAVFESSFCLQSDGETLDEKYENAKDKVIATVAAASKKFEQAGLCTRLKIVYMEGFCDRSRDPYAPFVALNKSGCGNTGMLQGVQRYWMQNKSNIPRDVVHVFSGTGLECINAVQCVVGCAYIGAMCNPRGAYSISHTYFSQDTNLQAVLTAHELGHSAGARHFGQDSAIGYVMSKQVNPARFGFSSTSIESIMGTYGRTRCIDQEINVTLPPTAAPTQAPTVPTPGVPKANTDDDGVVGGGIVEEPNCMAGSTGLVRAQEERRNTGIRVGSTKEVVLVRDVKVGDKIVGLDEQMRPTTCTVEAVGYFGNGLLYSNYTADHYVVRSEQIVAHGTKGEGFYDDRYDVLTSCPLGVDESGTAFTAIDSNFCGADATRSMSWSDYLEVHAIILRIVRHSGGYWFSSSAYKNMGLVKQHTPNLCKTMLECAKDHEQCEEMEQVSHDFIHNVLSDAAREASVGAFTNLGDHQSEGSVSAVVSQGRSVRRLQQ